MTVSLQPINRENFEECIKLSLKEDQKHFVASNVYSIAESKVDPDMIIYAIFSDETMVGFLAYEQDYKVNEIFIDRFMIDQRFQGKGYGTKALELIKQMAEKDSNVKFLRLSTCKENTNGIRLYKKFGFIDTGRIEYDENVYELILPNKNL